MHIYFKKGSHSARRKNDLVVNRIKTTTFGEKSLRTLGPKICNSLPEDVKDLTCLPKFTESIKTWYGLECIFNIWKYSGNPYHYTHGDITVNLNFTPQLEHVQVEISYPISTNKTSNETKQSYFDVSIVGFQCGLSHQGLFLFIFCFLFLVSDLIRSITVFSVQNLIFLLPLLVNIQILSLHLTINKE